MNTFPGTNYADWARKWAMIGYHVYPVRTALVAGEKRFSESWSNATNDVAEVEELFAKRPDANGVIVSTDKTDLVVVDIELKPGKDGFAAAAMAGIELPESPMYTKTWSGGEHRYFRQIPGRHIRNKQAEPCTDVDIRAGGGMVFAPPTMMGDSAYSFPKGMNALRVEDLPVLPQYFADLLSESKPARKSKGGGSEQIAEGPFNEYQDGKHLEWYEIALRDLTELVDGSRHQGALSPIGCAVDRGTKLGFPREQIEADVLKAYAESGGIDPDDMLKILDDAYTWYREGPMPAAAKVAPDPLAEAAGSRAAMIERLANDYEEQKLARLLADQRVAAANRVSVKERAVIERADHDGPDTSKRYWVNHMIAQSEVSYLVGGNYIGKTFVGVDLAMSMVTGRTWAGNTHTRPARVMYIACEDARGVATRVKWWAEAHGTDTHPEGLLIVDDVPLFGDSDDAAEYAEWVRASGTDVVIIDTLNESLGQAEFNERSKLQSFLQGLRTVQAARPDVGILVIAHPNGKGKLPGNEALSGPAQSIVYAESDDDGLTLRAGKWKPAQRQYGDLWLAVEDNVLRSRAVGQQGAWLW